MVGFTQVVGVKCRTACASEKGTGVLRHRIVVLTLNVLSNPANVSEDAHLRAVVHVKLTGGAPSQSNAVQATIVTEDQGGNASNPNKAGMVHFTMGHRKEKH